MLYIYSFMVRINFIVISKVKFCHRLIWEGLGWERGVGIQWYLYVIRSDAYCCNMYIYKRKNSMVNIFHRKVTTQRQQFFETGKETKTKQLKGVLFAKVNETDFYQLPHIQFKNNFSLFLCV